MKIINLSENISELSLFSFTLIFFFEVDEWRKDVINDLFPISYGIASILDLFNSYPFQYQVKKLATELNKESLLEYSQIEQIGISFRNALTSYCLEGRLECKSIGEEVTYRYLSIFYMTQLYGDMSTDADKTSQGWFNDMGRLTKENNKFRVNMKPSQIVVSSVNIYDVKSIDLSLSDGINEWGFHHGENSRLLNNSRVRRGGSGNHNKDKPVELTKTVYDYFNITNQNTINQFTIWLATDKSTENYYIGRIKLVGNNKLEKVFGPLETPVNQKYQPFVIIHNRKIGDRV